jgi:hypothetical protein
MADMRRRDVAVELNFVLLLPLLASRPGGLGLSTSWFFIFISVDFFLFKCFLMIKWIGAYSTMCVTKLFTSSIFQRVCFSILFSPYYRDPFTPFSDEGVCIMLNPESYGVRLDLTNNVQVFLVKPMQI